LKLRVPLIHLGLGARITSWKHIPHPFNIWTGPTTNTNFRNPHSAVQWFASCIICFQNGLLSIHVWFQVLFFQNSRDRARYVKYTL